MCKVLVINASARTERSLSRQLTEIFTANWIEKYPNDSIAYRDIGQQDIPHVTEKWIASAFKPAEFRGDEDEQVLKISNELIAELKDADVVVLGTPMYNWSVPSVLKAYIDQILRVNETVLVNKMTPENPYTGLLSDKRAYLLMVRGNAGYDPGEFYEHMDFQTNYLKTVFSIIGIKDVELVSANGIDIGSSSWGEAGEKIKKLIYN